MITTRHCPRPYSRVIERSRVLVPAAPEHDHLRRSPSSVTTNDVESASLRPEWPGVPRRPVSSKAGGLPHQPPRDSWTGGHRLESGAPLNPHLPTTPCEPKERVHGGGEHRVWDGLTEGQPERER